MSLETILINPLLQSFFSTDDSPDENQVTSDEIARAISYIFTNQLSQGQTASLLTCMHYTGWDRKADVIAKCAAVMRAAASQIDRTELDRVVKLHGRSEGSYQGGLVSFMLFYQRKPLIQLSVISSVREVIHITHLTYQQLRQSWPRPYFS